MNARGFLLFFIFALIGASFGVEMIDTCEQLSSITLLDKTASYQLSKDLDCSNISSFMPIGTSVKPFMGTLDGNNFLVRNLKIFSLSTDSVGLIGFAVGAVLKNLNFLHANISALQNGVGVLVGEGWNSTVISNCNIFGDIYNKSTITSSGKYVGALVGLLHYSLITNCTVSNTVVIGSGSNSSQYGGVVGRLENGSQMSGCHYLGFNVNPSLAVMVSQIKPYQHTSN